MVCAEIFEGASALACRGMENGAVVAGIQDTWASNVWNYKIKIL